MVHSFMVLYKGFTLKKTENDTKIEQM